MIQRCALALALAFTTSAFTTSAYSAEISTLERAYLKELTFLKAEKAEMEKRAAVADAETERILSTARAEVDALGAKLLDLRRRSDLAEELLREPTPAVLGEKVDAVYDALARARDLAPEAESLPELPKDRTPTDEELAAATAAAFLAAAEQIEAGAKIHVEAGVFYGLDGAELQGRVVRVGRIAAYGVAGGASGVLAPAGQGRMKLFPADAAAAADDGARELAEGRSPSLLPIFLVESFDEAPKEIASAEPNARMNEKNGIVSSLMSLPIFQAEWVLYLLIILSLISVALMVERTLFYRKHRVDIETIRARFKDFLLRGDFAAAADYLSKYDSLETNVTLFGLREYQTGPDSVEDLLRGAEARERLRYNRWLSFLATVGSNSPFIGLFGTVLGIIRAFGDLAVDAGAAGGGSVMAGISEALIATAVGLLVAIPAVIAYNAFMGKVKTVLANSELLSRTLLSALKSHDLPAKG